MNIDNSALEQLYPPRVNSPIYQMQEAQPTPPPPPSEVHYLDLIAEAARSGQALDFNFVVGFRR